MSLQLPVTKKTKMSDLINYRLKVSTIDNRSFTGTLLAFDKHLNLVLHDTEESRITKKGYQELIKEGKPKYEKRVLGLVILRGDQVVSLSIELGKVLGDKQRVESKGLLKGKGKSKVLKTVSGSGKK